MFAAALLLRPPPRLRPSLARGAEVADLLPGTYVSRDPAASVRFAVAAVPKNRIADEAPVFYLEAAKSARPDAPFLQRFLKLEADGARVVLRVYEPRDLAGVRGKWREPEALAVFTDRDVRERPDCRMTLAKSPAGHWAGGTAAATCFSAAGERARSRSRCRSRRRRSSGARRARTRWGRPCSAPRERSRSMARAGGQRPSRRTFLR